MQNGCIVHTFVIGRVLAIAVLAVEEEQVGQHAEHLVAVVVRVGHVAVEQLKRLERLELGLQARHDHST